LTPSDAGVYSVVASNASGSVTSNPAILNVVPLYSDGPSDMTVLLLNQAYLGVNFLGRTPLTNLTWFHNGADIAGAANSSISFLATPEGGGSYFGVACKQSGCVTSGVATVTGMSRAPVFPGSLFGYPQFVAGLTNYLSSPANAGPPAEYFWYHDGV